MSCAVPVVFFVYRRPDSAQKVFDEIRAAKPATLIIVSDGARNADEQVLVERSRDLAEQVDWECDLVKVYSDKNLGCKRRFFTALDFVFSNYQEAIILEDDCVPSPEFFEFCQWGLREFRATKEVALISGSNLFPIDKTKRNGFSRYMNCWGWATWATTWHNVNRYIGFRDLEKTRRAMIDVGFFNWEAHYWTEVIKHAISSNSIWDFYVQHYMLTNGLFSVYPSFNLVENIGFDAGATHTSGQVPDYVIATKPSRYSGLMSLEPDSHLESSFYRDRELARKIWSCRLINFIRLRLTNSVRFFAS